MVGLLNIASVASVVNRQRNEALTKQQLDERQNEPVLLGIAAYLRVCWDAAVAAKQPIEKVMLKALRQRNGTYEPDKLQAIKLHGGSGVFMMLTEVKCRGAESWLRDILMDDGTPPWALSPTPKPDLPDDQEKLITDIVAQYVTTAIQALGKAPTPEEMAQLKETAAQELRFARLKDAQERADRMQTKIEDQFAQGGWPESFNEFITDLTTFPAAFVKGPIVRRQRKLEWAQDQAGKTVARTTEVLAPEYDRADPFMIYPEPGITNINDGYLFEHHPMPRHELAALIGVPGYDSAAVREILDTGPGSSWVTQADKTEKDAEERKFSVDQRPTDIFDALQFWGKISGKMLIEWGLSEKEVPDPQREYDAEVWLIGNYVIKALLNYDPLGEKPYAKTSFIRTPGAFWGKGIPEIIEDLQNVCNAAVRALVNNLGIACLTGDTVVYREARDKKYAEVTLDELWAKKHQHNSGLRRTKLRSLDEDTGEFFGNRVVDIIDNGVADVFLVTTARGYKIKATGTHRFMREDGEWQHLDDFDEGELIAVNGQTVPLPKTCIECGADTARRGVRCRSCASKAHNSSWNQKQITMATSSEVQGTTARARHVCQSQKKSFCQECGADEGALLEIHHKDRAPWNNSADNLQTLCSPCHHKLHAYEDSFGNPRLHKYVSYDTIESIVFVGQERVFDLSMTAPHHNFIANGFISHNSGPQVEVNTERVPVGEDISEIYPWKIWQVLNDPLGSSAPAVRFNQPNDNSAQLIGVYDKFSKLADDHSGVPSYIYGDLNVQGAGRTASGLSMLMGSAGKGIRQVVMHIDSDIIKPVVQRQFVYNMRYVDDESIKGDVQIVPKGAINLAVKDTVNVRRVEFLNATANQFDMEIIGKSGRAAVLREVAKGLQMPAEEVVPSQDKQDLTAELKAAQPQPQQAPQAQPPKPLSAGGLSPGGRQGNTVTPRGPQGG